MKQFLSTWRRVFWGLVLLLAPGAVMAQQEAADLTHHWVGIVSLVVFVLAYAVVMAEESLHLRKSKPVLLAAGIIWGIIGGYATVHGTSVEAEEALRHNLLEYAELLLFLLVAMTYINAMEERRLFDVLRVWLIRNGFGFRTLFWITGLLAFFISPVADNLTTALLMCAVIIKTGQDDKRFVNLACINVVVAANAGGAFSPFGDITTLMVWQKGVLPFVDFFALFIPAVVNFMVPAVIMSLFVPDRHPRGGGEFVELKRGGKRIVGLFLLTILTAVLGHIYLQLPPVYGMMTGLAYLQLFGYFLRRSLPRSLAKKRARAEAARDEAALQRLGGVVPFDVFSRIAHAEWDTLLFFYGVVMCVGGLGFIGYLEMVSQLLYTQWSPTYANISVGLLSSVVDNIPVMFAVLSMSPHMSDGQWMLVTLTAGVGGSLLSIGSAAGVALMGQARGQYTFFGHLRWTPAILLGYIASILVHFWINQSLF